MTCAGRAADGACSWWSDTFQVNKKEDVIEDLSDRVPPREAAITDLVF